MHMEETFRRNSMSLSIVVGVRGSDRRQSDQVEGSWEVGKLGMGIQTVTDTIDSW